MFLMTCLSRFFPLLLILPVLSPCLSSPMSVLTCCVIDFFVTNMSRIAYTDLTQNNLVPLLPAHYCMSVFILSKHNYRLFFCHSLLFIFPIPLFNHLSPNISNFWFFSWPGDSLLDLIKYILALTEPSSLTHFSETLTWAGYMLFRGSVSLLRSSWYCLWDFAVRGNWVSSSTSLTNCTLLK